MKKSILITTLILLIGLTSLTNFSFSQTTEIKATNDGCYFAVVISNSSWTKRDKTFIRSSVGKLTCTDLFGGGNMKQDLQKQFFYYLYDNHNKLLKVFKGDSRYSSITPFFGNSKAKVLSDINKYYRVGNNYSKHVMNDFNYIKDKFSPATLGWKKSSAMTKEINEYLKNGIEINR